MKTSRLLALLIVAPLAAAAQTNLIPITAQMDMISRQVLFTPASNAVAAGIHPAPWMLQRDTETKRKLTEARARLQKHEAAAAEAAKPLALRIAEAQQRQRLQRLSSDTHTPPDLHHIEQTLLLLNNDADDQIRRARHDAQRAQTEAQDARDEAARLRFLHNLPR